MRVVCLPSARAMSALTALRLHGNQALAAEVARLDRLHAQADEQASVAALLAVLPERTTHRVMVPVIDGSTVAFFPGQLVHTNELFLRLGGVDGELLAERSATQAVATLRQREAALRSTIAGARGGLEALRQRDAALEALSSDAEGVVEIREVLSEEEARVMDAQYAAPRPRSEAASRTGDEDDLFARLEALELEEARAEAGERAQHEEKAAVPAVPRAAPASTAFSGQVLEREDGAQMGGTAQPEAPRPVSRFMAGRGK